MHHAGGREPREIRTALAVDEVVIDDRGLHVRALSILARGGMSEVWRGREEETGRVVAIKTIDLDHTYDDTVASRTRFEAETLRALHHPNVVRVFSSGLRRDGVFFMVMEHLEGMTLRELHTTLRQVPIPWSLALMAEVCDGLSAIHERALHRDLSPANIHFGVDGRVRILDLGVAKCTLGSVGVTSTAAPQGTVAYMAPERIDESAPVDATTDLWSAAVILYELLTGRHPFARGGKLPDKHFYLTQRIVEGRFAPVRSLAPLCPEEVAVLIERALSRDPRVRPQTAEGFGEALRAALAGWAVGHGPLRSLDDLAAELFPEGGRRSSGIVEKGQGRVEAPRRMPRWTKPLGTSSRLSPPIAVPREITLDMELPVPDLGLADHEALSREARAPSPPYPDMVPIPAPPARRRSGRRRAWPAVALAVVLVALGIWMLGGESETPPPAPPPPSAAPPTPIVPTPVRPASPRPAPRPGK